MKSAFFSVFTLILLSFQVSAKAMPEFEGVYIRLNDGSLVELLELGAPEQFYAPPLTSSLSAPNIIVNGVTKNELAKMPVVQASNIKSFVVNNRDPRIEFVNEIVRLNDYLPAGYRTVRGPSIITSGLMAVPWGYPAKNSIFLVRNVSNFVSEYESKLGFNTSINGYSVDTAKQTGIYVPIAYAVSLENGRMYGFRTKWQKAFGDLELPQPSTSPTAPPVRIRNALSSCLKEAMTYVDIPTREILKLRISLFVDSNENFLISEIVFGELPDDLGSSSEFWKFILPGKGSISAICSTKNFHLGSSQDGYYSTTITYP